MSFQSPQRARKRVMSGGSSLPMDSSSASGRHDSFGAAGNAVPAVAADMRDGSRVTARDIDGVATELRRALLAAKNLLHAAESALEQPYLSVQDSPPPPPLCDAEFNHPDHARAPWESPDGWPRVLDAEKKKVSLPPAPGWYSRYQEVQQYLEHRNARRDRGEVGLGSEAFTTAVEAAHWVVCQIGLVCPVWRERKLSAAEEEFWRGLPEETLSPFDVRVRQFLDKLRAPNLDITPASLARLIARVQQEAAAAIKDVEHQAEPRAVQVGISPPPSVVAGHWRANTAEPPSLAPTEKRILAAIEEAGKPLNQKSIAKALRQKLGGNLKMILAILVQRGVLLNRRSRGYWPRSWEDPDNS